MDDVEREGIDWTRRRPGGADRKKPLTVLLSTTERALIEHGALATDESLAGFCRQAAIERAKKIEEAKHE